MSKLTKFKAIIRDKAVDLTLNKQQFTLNETPLIKNKQKLLLFTYKSMKRYASFRLDMLNNKSITEVEQKIVTSAVKAGVKYACRQFDITVDSTTIDQMVDKIMPEILDYIHSLRIKVFENIEAHYESKLQDKTK